MGGVSILVDRRYLRGVCSVDDRQPTSSEGHSAFVIVANQANRVESSNGIMVLSIQLIAFFVVPVRTIFAHRMRHVTVVDRKQYVWRSSFAEVFASNY